MLEAIEDSKGNDIHYLYDNDGKLLEIRHSNDYKNDPLNYYNNVKYKYDLYDRIKEIQIKDGYFYSFSYDDQNRISSVNINNNTDLITYIYEIEGSFFTNRLSELQYANRDTIIFEYNDKNLIQTINFKDEINIEPVSKFSYEYNGLGRVSILNTFHNGIIVKSEYYTYDSSNNLTKIVDDAGNFIDYSYNSEGMLTNLNFHIEDESHFVSYTYNKDLYFGEQNQYNTISNLYDKTEYKTEDNLQVVVDYNYESTALYRLQNINTKIGNKELLKYTFMYYNTPNGNSTNRITKITYNILGHTTVFSLDYEYDSLGNLLGYYYKSNGIDIYKYNYVYDSLNRLKFEDIYIHGDTSYTNMFTYDSNGNILEKLVINYKAREASKIEVPVPYYINNSIGPVEMTCNGSEYLYIQKVNIGENPQPQFVFYNPNTYEIYPVKIIEQTYSNLNINKAGYYYSDYIAMYKLKVDVKFRIVFKVGEPRVDGAYYVYNWLWKDQLNTYEVIKNGLSTKSEISYDNLGNPTCITNFKYNSLSYAYANFIWEGRELKELIIKDTNKIVVSRITYTYNDQGLRTSKTIIENGNSNTTTYHLSGSNVLMETDGVNVIIFSYNYDGSLISFNYDNKNDTLSGQDYFYVKDLQGNIIKIVDTAGKVLVDYKFDAYGLVSINDFSSNNLSKINPYTYRGYRYDIETSLYYCNSRYYVPEWGRWLNADDVSYLNPSSVNGLNLYAYCANNPVMNVDPNGTFISTILGGIFGGIIGGISAVARGDNFWEGAAHGATVGAAVGLIVDFAVLTGGAGGLAIASFGGFAVGTVGDAASQMIFDDKAFININWGHAFAVGGLTALTSVASFGFGSVVNFAIGKSPTGSLFTQLIKSLSPIYTPAGSWAFQGLTGFAISAFSLIQL